MQPDHRAPDQSKFASNLFVLDAAQGVLFYSYGEASLRFSRSNQLRNKRQIAALSDGTLAFLDDAGAVSLCGRITADGLFDLDQCVNIPWTGDGVVYIAASSDGEFLLAATRTTVLRLHPSGHFQSIAIPTSVVRIVSVAGNNEEVFISFDDGRTIGTFDHAGQTLALRADVRVNLAGIAAFPPDSIDFDVTSVARVGNSYVVHIHPHGHTIQYDSELNLVDWWSVYSLPYPGRPFHSATRLRATAGNLNELQYVDRRSLTVFTDYDMEKEGRYAYRLPPEVSDILDIAIERHEEIAPFPVTYDLLKDPEIRAQIDTMKAAINEND